MDKELIRQEVQDYLEAFKKAELNEETDEGRWNVPDYARVRRIRPVREQIKEIREDVEVLKEK